MYQAHFGLQQAPFRITPDADYFFEGGQRGELLAALLYAVSQGEGLIKVTGEVGTGKTMLSRVLAERLPPNVDVVYLINPNIDQRELLESIADELGISLLDSHAGTLLRSLRLLLIARYAAGRQVVVVIDEAHAMPEGTLEAVRLLSNLESSKHKLLQLVLFGQPELDIVLAKPSLRQVRDRITQAFFLGPLTPVEVSAYLDFRIQVAGYSRETALFDPGAIRLLSKRSAGWVRRLNILADKSLLSAFAQGREVVSATDVQRAWLDSEHTVSGVRAWLRARRHQFFR